MVVAAGPLPGKVGPCGRKKRRRVFDKDGHQCRLCGARAKDIYITVDHIVPRSKGGSNDLSNLRTLCKPCNERKADKLWAGELMTR